MSKALSHKMKKYGMRLSALFAVLNLLILTGSVSSESLPLKDRVVDSGSTPIDSSNLTQATVTYANVLQRYEKENYAPALSESVTLPVADAVVPDGTHPPLRNNIGGVTESVLYWEEQEWVEWTFSVPSDGLYSIDLTYFAIDNSVSDITRSLVLNGEVPFEEADELRFYRHWRDAYEPKTNSLGNEIKPQQEQIQEWITTSLSDSQGEYADAFCFYLTQGLHTLRFLYIDCPMAIKDIVVRPATVLPSYKDYIKSFSDKSDADVSRPETIQAESAVIWKSQQTLQRQHDGDPATVPQSNAKKLNVLGGENWNIGGQTITWTIKVPIDGLYKIGLRVKQSYGDGLPSHRKIAIDGLVPFAELSEYAFAYKSDWYIETLSDNKGTPFLFYLTAGTSHTISLTSLQGGQGEAATKIETVVSDLLELTRKIRLFTGSDPDVNYDYQLPSKIPNLLDDMQATSTQLSEVASDLEAIAASRASVVSEIKMVVDQLDNLVLKPDTIARRIRELSDSLSTLSTASTTLREQKLAIDYFLIGASDQEFGNGKSSVFQKLSKTVKNFILSFFLDYNSVGDLGETEDYPTITVWVSRGQEWAEVMKQLIDDRFTPTYHINVRMNLLPASQLNAGAVSAILLAVSSGDAPDVATSVAFNTPAEFAFRNAVIDLSAMPGYDQIAERFFKQITVPFQYKNGIYALPETMNFRVLFYRRDILSSLGLGIPNTWEDVYNSVFPVLAQNGMQFYYPKDSSLFLYQNGGNYYNDSWTLSALDTPVGYKSMKEYTDLFTVYGVPNVADFFNRFRSGEMPIGIESTTVYLQLLSAAPELTGKWGVSMVPGHLKKDGMIDRSAGGLAGETAVIFSQSTKQAEAWEFLKWWTSTDVQVTFGRQVESILGTAARWNSANKEAYRQTPWNKTDLSIFMQQMEWLIDPPTLPGSYMNSRHLENMWNRIVLGKVSVRDSIEQAAEDINKELISKAKEFS